MKRIFLAVLLGVIISFSVSADEKSNAKVEDCWKGFNKASFAINQTLDGILFEPLAKGYRYYCY